MGNLLNTSDETTLSRTGIESLDALIRCQKKGAKMIEIIHIKKQDDTSDPDNAGHGHKQIALAEDNEDNEDIAVLNGTRPHVNNIRVDTIEQKRKREMEEPEQQPDLISAVVGQDDGGVGDDD